MKIGIFTDSHYTMDTVAEWKRNSAESLRKTKEAFEHFKSEKCELVICLGDLIDADTEHSLEAENLKKMAEVIKTSGIETYCVMGNHDAFSFTEDEFYGILGEDFRPRRKDADGKTLLFLDACYFKDGRRYMPGDRDWTDTFLPDAAELEKELEKSCGETYIFMHQNLDPDLPDEFRLANEEEVRGILEKSGVVKEVIQGHYHLGNRSEHNGIRYTTFPAMRDEENGYFTVEI